MVKQRVCRIGFVLTALVAVGPWVAPRDAVAQDPAAREWNQAFGGADRSGFSPLDPVATIPVEAWRVSLPGPVQTEPVSWGGMVYVVAGEGRGRVLAAFDASSGAAAGTYALAGKGPVSLAAWQGRVIVTQPGSIKGIPHDGETFGRAWSLRTKVAGPPCIYRGFLFAGDQKHVICVDARTGRKLAKADGLTPQDLLLDGDEEVHVKPKDALKATVVGPTAAYFDPEDKNTYAVNLSVFDRYLVLSRTRVTGLDGAKPKPKMSLTRSRVVGRLENEPGETTTWEMMPSRITKADGSEGAWLVLTKDPLEGGGNGRYVADDSTGKGEGLDLATFPASAGGLAFGFDAFGSLTSRAGGSGGSTKRVVSKSALPKGAGPAPASAAGNVFFFGNWALDATKGRVLWVREDVTPVTRAVPVGNGRMVVGTKSGALVCIAEKEVADRAAAGAKTAAALDRSRPPDTDGILLADGRFVVGSIDGQGNGIYEIEPEDGEAFTARGSEIAVARIDGQIEFAGEDVHAYGIWLDAVRGEYIASLKKAFAAYVKAKSSDDCHRVIARCREMGLSEEQANAMVRELSGIKGRADVRKLAGVAEQETAALEKMIQGIQAGIRWCSERELLTAATVLLVEEERLTEGKDESVEARAVELTPPGFPFKSGRNPGHRWMRWAEQLIVAGAEFLPPEDPAWDRLKTPPWTQGGRPRCLGFRTRNLLLYSMDPGEDVIGPLLRFGEGAIRVNQALLMSGNAGEVTSDRDRMEVRLHADRGAYLSEETNGSTPVEWSAGFYSPSIRACRFYVTRGPNGELKARWLGQVMAHELTHQFAAERWNAGKGRGGSSAGYWVVEGLADFLEGQAVELRSSGARFDDPGVESIDAVAQLYRAKKLIPLKRLVDLSNGAFHGELRNNEDGGGWTVKLKRSMKTQSYSERGIFYIQSGALAYFLVHEAGYEKREAFVRYMRSYYDGRGGPLGWIALGYESAEELEKEFHAFLDRISE